MWLLLIVLLNVVPGVDAITVFQSHDTVQECLRERSRIGFAMAEAYPYEWDFVITCHLNHKHES